MATGIRKLYEALLREGRTLVITNPDLLGSSNLPNGTVYVDPANGDMKVKNSEHPSGWQELHKRGVIIDHNSPDPDDYEDGQLWLDMSE